MEEATALKAEICGFDSHHSHIINCEKWGCSIIGIAPALQAG